jgi:hypothetical protein
MKTFSFDGKDIPICMLVAFLLSLTIMALIGPRLAEAKIQGYFWGFFIFCNLCYILTGIKKGWAKPDIGNGLVIASGPIAFYSWTITNAWIKYSPRIIQWVKKSYCLGKLY